MSSKIKINPVTKEIEIEVSDDFLIKYFEEIGLSLGKSKKVKLEKKIRKVTNTNKSPKGANYNAVIEVIRLGKDDGTTINEIVEATKLTKTQISQVITNAKKKGVIKSTERGIYEYVKEVKEDV